MTSYRIVVVAVVPLLISACRGVKQEAFGCLLTRQEAAYGLSGEWSPGNGNVSRRLCLRQVSPVRITGLTERNGQVEHLVGAVAPSGAIFVTSYTADPIAFSFVGRRQEDTITVDWLAEAGFPDQYAAGNLIKKR